MTTTTQITEIVAKLTVNGAINLHFAAERERLDEQTGRLHTGLGKYTTLAAIGVENHLTKLGLVEFRPNRDGNTCRYWTPLGKEVARYLLEHWDEHAGKFRRGSRDA